MFDKYTNTVTLIIFGIRGSNPPRYMVYDAHDPAAARKRIEEKHDDYQYLGQEVMFGKEEAKQMSSIINKAMLVYPDLLRKYPMPAETTALR